MRIPPSPLLPVVLALLAAAARPAEPNAEVVKAVRAMLDTKKEDERDAMKAALLKRPDFDWASLKAGLEAGPYYQKPLETAYGERGSKSTFDIVFSGEDGKPRGFSMWVPKKYDAKERLPVLFYLHHDPQSEHTQAGAEKAAQALVRFRQICEDRGIFVVAPYTSRGAEWWVPEGRKLVAWTLRQVRQRFNIDDDRIGLVGALGGGDAVWYLGQEMPGTWSVLMPMTGDPYEITALIRPLFLGTLDRMDVLMGVPGKTQSAVGEKDLDRFLADLKPMFGQGMRITTAIWPGAAGDFSYLEQVAPQIGSFVCDRTRKGYPDEVDVEVEAGDGLRALWLRNDGYDPEGSVAPGHFGFHSTHLKWTAPERPKAERKIGVDPEARDGMPGLFIKGTPGEAGRSQIFPGDVLLEVDGVPVSKIEDLKVAVEKTAFGDEVRLLLARDVKEADLARHDRIEARYKRYRTKLKELKDAGTPIPGNLWDEMAEEEGPGEEEGAAEEEEEEDDSGITMSDDAPAEPEDGGGGGGAIKETKKTVRLIGRWVKIRRQGGVLVRADFGAQWDPAYNKTEGVRVASVYAGSLAARSGFKDGDLIVGAGGKAVKTVHDIEDALATINEGDTPFRFEEEPEGENFIDFTIRRPNADGTFQADQGLTVRWKPVQSSRVDARWDKKENTLHVLANRASGFTLYFTDALIEPGKEFNLFINGVPYQDLVNPETAPQYPKDHGETAAADELYRLRRKRAKIEGWTPDPAWALEDFMTTWDRKQVYGAKRSFDLTKMKKGFDQASARGKREDDLGPRVRKAYDEYPGRAKG